MWIHSHRICEPKWNNKTYKVKQQFVLFHSCLSEEVANMGGGTACNVKTWNVYKIFTEKPHKREHLTELDVDGMLILLKHLSGKWDMNQEWGTTFITLSTKAPAAWHYLHQLCRTHVLDLTQIN